MDIGSGVVDLDGLVWSLYQGTFAEEPASHERRLKSITSALRSGIDFPAIICACPQADTTKLFLFCVSVKAR